MLGARIYVRRGRKEEGERPFWISFSDLMTALMVVFLLVMSVALLSVTKEVTAKEKAEAKRRQDIKQLLQQLKDATSQEIFSGVTVHDDIENPYIDFGSRATFSLDRSNLTTDQAKLLRAFVPEILAKADSEIGRAWFRQVIVEGYTDSTGTYLHNLNLSLQRSERVVCALLEALPASEFPLMTKEKAQVRKLFLVGGYSSNSAKADPASSRRIELKLRFWELNDPERHSQTEEAGAESDVGNCAL